MTELRDLPDRVVLALCVWGEARGEPVEGQIAVACVIRNRVRLANVPQLRWRDVILAPLQFSCFNPGDPNRALIDRAVTHYATQQPTPELQQALWIADGVISGACADNTGGATNYLTGWLFRQDPPQWAKLMQQTKAIGAHVFLRA